MLFFVILQLQLFGKIMFTAVAPVTCGDTSTLCFNLQQECVSVFLFRISEVTLSLTVMCEGVLDEFSPLLHEDRHIRVQDDAGIQTHVDYFIYFAVT